MKLALVAALSIAATAPAQTPQPTAPFTDPANLRGERISPHTGRELPIDQGALGLQQTLRKLNTRASLMLIVAHPDDEDGGLLTLYSRGLGARAATLTLTRGEGGQNAMTGDFEDALGLIRTQELLSADRYMGIDQMFGTEVDFGFSKTKEEAFAKWGHQRVLYDAVRAVRLYRPLVIAAVFIGGVTDGHGQHQVSGEIAQEVFKAAGDPKVFPELTAEGILPWQPLKVYARVPMQAITPQGLFDYATNQYAPARFTNYVTGQVSTTPPTPDVVVHEGQTDSLLSYAAADNSDLRDAPAEPNAPLSYVQFARIGLGLQRTQIGPGVRVAPAGAFDISYHRYGSMLPNDPQHEDSFFDGIDTSLESIASLSSKPPAQLTATLHALSTEIAQMQRDFHPQHPDALAPSLAKAQDQLSRLLYGLEQEHFPGKTDVLHELRIKQVQLNQALTDALGLNLTATADAPTPEVARGAAAAVQTQLTTRSSQQVGVYSEALQGSMSQKSEKLLAVDAEPTVATQQPFHLGLTATPALTADITRPYFFRTDVEQPVYQLSDPNLRNAPSSVPGLTAWATLRYHQIEVQVGRIVDVGRQPLQIVPPLSVSLSAQAQALPEQRGELQLSMFVAPAAQPLDEQQLVTPQGWHITAQAKGAQPGETQYTVRTPAQPHAAKLQATARLANGATFNLGYRPVGYGDLPRTNFYTVANDRIVPVDLKLPTYRRIGYLAGTGDAVPQALASIGLPVTELTVADLTPERLSQFDTVVLGVRTYNAHPDLHGAPTQALLNFARNGGNVILQYQTAEFTGADAPYPLTLGNAEKVVDETAPVELLQTQAPALSTPNRITSADFNGWIEERGHGLLHTWDPQYAALTETHDPGGPETRPQAPQQGGLITTQLGRGHWTYCAFALYRQLPEAVPGAFRLFVNLLGLADTGTH